MTSSLLTRLREQRLNMVIVTKNVQYIHDTYIQRYIFFYSLCLCTLATDLALTAAGSLWMVDTSPLSLVLGLTSWFLATKAKYRDHLRYSNARSTDDPGPIHSPSSRLMKNTFIFSSCKGSLTYIVNVFLYPYISVKLFKEIVRLCNDNVIRLDRCSTKRTSYTPTKIIGGANHAFYTSPTYLMTARTQGFETMTIVLSSKYFGRDF